jgi:hypothetical protein
MLREKNRGIKIKDHDTKREWGMGLAQADATPQLRPAP